MMKFSRAIVPIAVVMVFLLTAFIPSASAETVTYSGEFTFNNEYRFMKTDLRSDSEISPDDHYSDPIYICNEEQFTDFQKHGGTEPACVKVVHEYDSVDVPSGTYWIVTHARNLAVINKSTGVSGPTQPMDKICLTFTMVQQSKCKVNISIPGNTHDVSILLTDEHNLAAVNDGGVTTFVTDHKKLVEYYDSGFDSEFSFSTSVTNTAKYALVIECVEPCTINVDVTVEGAANFINSTALSVILIVFAVAVVGALLFISMRKIM